MSNEFVMVPREQLTKVREWIESARDGVLYPIARDFEGVVGRNAEGLGQETPALLDLIDAILVDSAESSASECRDGGMCGDSSHKCTGCAPVERDERALIELALSEYGKATGKHVLPGGINENQDGFVHGFLARAALERKPS